MESILRFEWPIELFWLLKNYEPNGSFTMLSYKKIADILKEKKVYILHPAALTIWL